MADLRFGTFLAPDMLPVYRAVADAVGKTLGLTTELVVEADYERCRSDANDIFFICSLPYVMFERDGISPATPIAAPVLVGERYEDRPIYFSDVIVHPDSPAESFLDLRGSRWAYNEPLSQSGYGIVRYHLVSIGETSGFFSEVVRSGFHEKSIEMVAAGQVDAAAIDSQVLALKIRNDPSLAERVKVIDALGPSTIQPVAASNRLDSGLRASIREVLVDFAATPEGKKILSLGLVKRWAPVDESDYDDIRAMVQACEDAGYMEIR